MFGLPPLRHTPTLPSSPIRRVVSYRLQSADSGRSWGHYRTAGIDPHRTLSGRNRSSAIAPEAAFPKFLLSRPSRPTAGIRKSLHANASTERTAKWESTPGRASNSDQTISRRLQFFDGRGQEGLVNTRTGRGEQKVGVAGNVRNSRGSLPGVKQGDCFSLPEASGGTIWTATVGMYCKSGSCSYSQ
jgi:hypothetical protein